MVKPNPIGRAFLFMTAVCVLAMGCISTAVAGEDETEILKITVGKPTKLSDLAYQNTASLAVSRTGVVAAFYPKPRTGPRFYRTSTDLGRTWGQEMDSPAVLAGGSATATLRDGGVLKFLTTGSSFKGEAEFRVAPLEGEYIDGWFKLHSTFAWFNDDFSKFEVASVQVYMPDAPTSKQPQLVMGKWPTFADDKMIQLANGDLLASMQGSFKGDAKGRTTLCISSDRGHKWRHYATVAYDPVDPNPDLPGQYLGYAEPSFELLPNGQMICAMRTQYAHINAEYRPIHVSWSDDMGKSWTKPVATTPHLMNICPELAALDNGVLACQYGRPGFHVVFSLDDGHTWQDRVSFSHLPEPIITGQFDMIKVGPNDLIAIGSDKSGVKAWPLSVERIKVVPSHVTLTGRVQDKQGNPVVGAFIERGPNRYTADDWQEHETDLDRWSSPTLIGSPRLAFRSIQEINDYPTVRTDAQGQFRFDKVKLGEYVLTVEADRYAPQQRHIKVDTQPEPAEFTLKAGRLVRGRVVDAEGHPIGGVCVVLNHWHCHTDPQGYYHWSVVAPVPAQVTLRVYKRYNGDYETLKTTVALSQLESQPITLKNR
jgi:protocatechuate 3,4-dioxygenase beta subunit